MGWDGKGGWKLGVKLGERRRLGSTGKGGKFITGGAERTG